jgi:hypothetical protein
MTHGDTQTVVICCNSTRHSIKSHAWAPRRAGDRNSYSYCTVRTRDFGARYGISEEKAFKLMRDSLRGGKINLTRLGVSTRAEYCNFPSLPKTRRLELSVVGWWTERG